MAVIPILVTEANCRPASQIKRLADAGRLPRFTDQATEENPDGLGDCHEAALAMMTDLVVAQEALGWKWACGRVVHRVTGKEMEHSWLEHSGWALDCANGKLVFMRRAEYRQYYQARDVVVRDARATERLLRRE